MTPRMPERIVVEHLANIRATLLTYAKQVGLADHGGSVGSAREGLASHFLSRNLPGNVDFRAGEIFDSSDSRSGQIDLIVYPKSAPLIFLHDIVQMVFADLVIAAIEVKSTIKTGLSSNLSEAMLSCARVKRLRRLRPLVVGSGSASLSVNHVPYMVFAFDGPGRETLERAVEELQAAHRLRDEECPDLFVVLSKDFFMTQNNGWIFPKNQPWKWTGNADSSLLGMYVYLIKLIEAFYLEPRLTPFSEYLASSSR